MIEDDPRTQRVKIKYIGYSSRYKWRLSHIVDKHTLVTNEDSRSLRLHELNQTYQVQENILQVRIEIPFDRGMYNSNASLRFKGKED